MVGIKDVAKKAGVSISTVSNVINEEKPVSPELKARVREAVEAMRQAGLDTEEDLIAEGDYSPISGYHAMKILHDRIKDPDSPRRIVTLATELIVRKSTRSDGSGDWNLSGW